MDIIHYFLFKEILKEVKSLSYPSSRELPHYFDLFRFTCLTHL